MNNISIIIIGSFHTDIVALGATKLLQPGEHTYGEKLHIGPGGKSRNITEMIATLSTQKNVAMIGKTSKDPYGLWKLPIDSLKKVEVNLDFVTIESYEKTKQFPGIALIPVDKQGRNEIYVLSGINNDFSPKDIEDASDLFKQVAQNRGILVTTLEQPYKTALHAIKKANQMGIKVMFDPGGIREEQNYSELLEQQILLIKPNEHEAKILTGIEVKDFETAKKAAQKLLSQKAENVFITIGEQGGFLFNKNTEKHIPVPQINSSGKKDSTGCGDQTMAALVVAISEGKDVEKACQLAILAGTLQFAKQGIQPVTREEIEEYNQN